MPELIPPDKKRRLLAWLVRLHFAYVVTVPLLGLVGWWFVRRGWLPVMLICGFAAIAAYYALQAERYHLTTHLPSALWVVFASPLLLVVSSLLGGGFWFFYVEAAFVEVGGMCAGIVAGATVKGLKEREYFYPAVLYVFMGGFLLVWGWGVFSVHAGFEWYDNVWLLAALVNEVYGYGLMFASGELDLEYGHGRRARRSGAGLLPSPLREDAGASLIAAFAVLVVLSPFVIGLLNYFFK